MQQLIGISKITIRFFLPGFLFLILAGGPSYAGKIDSLKRTLQETDQLTHLKTLIEISNAYRKANPDSSYAYAQKALKLSGNQKYWSERLSAFDNLSTFFWDTREYDSSLLMLDSAIILSYKQTSDNDVAYFENSKGYRYWHMGMFPQALEKFMMSFEAHKRLDDEENMAYTLNNLSACYVRLGNYEKGLDMALKSLKIKEKKGNENDIAMSLINIGGILVKLGNDDDALEKYLSALGIFNKGKSHKYVGKCLSNIGSIYKRKGKLDIARQYYADAKERYVEANETMYLASVYRYIAGIDLKEGMVSNAMENYRNSLSICNDFQDHYGITTSKMGIGESLKILGDIAGAIRYFQEALTHAVEIGATDLQRDAHLSLSECYEKTGRNSSALDEYKLYAQLTDSLLNQDKVKNMNELQIRYETEKKEQEIRILKQQNEIDNLEIIRQNQQLRQQRNIIFVSVVMILLVGIILLLLFNRYRLKQVATKEKAKRKALQIESRLLRTQMNPHFLFNSLNSIQNYISDADTFMAETYLSKFAQLVRNILEHSRKNLITLEDDIRSLRLYLELEQLRFKGLFDFDISTSKQLDDDEYFIPPMLIQPFAENAIIHGIRHKPEKGHLAIRLNLADDLIICEVEDDGIGRRNSMEINKNRHKSPSMGMQVTQERIEVLRHQMNAGAEFRIIDLEDQDGKPAGTKVIVHIPFEQDI